jgi:hypothetical protein
VFCDTDSMAIIATETGGLQPCPGGPERDPQGREFVRALTWAQVDDIVRRFEALNPYNRAIVPGSVLEIEAENCTEDGERRQLYCYSISAKRYALYNLNERGEPEPRKISENGSGNSGQEDEQSDDPDPLTQLRKHSEHGLGHLLNPTDPEDGSRRWIEQLWQHILATSAPSTPSSKNRRRPSPWATRIMCRADHSKNPTASKISEIKMTATKVSVASHTMPTTVPTLASVTMPRSSAITAPPSAVHPIDSPRGCQMIRTSTTTNNPTARPTAAILVLTPCPACGW